MNFIERLMHAWESFLDSLATRGGAILVLLLLVLLGLGAGLHVLHHEPLNEKAIAFVEGFAAGAANALMLALSSGDRRANGKNQEGAAATPPQKS